jgi:hypothetical protein
MTLKNLLKKFKDFLVFFFIKPAPPGSDKNLPPWFIIYVAISLCLLMVIAYVLVKFGIIK